MKALALFLFFVAQASSSFAAAICPMEATDLRRSGVAQGLSHVALPIDVLWSVQLCGFDPQPRSNPIVLQDRVIQAFNYGTVCVSRVDGHLLWHASSFGDQWSPPTYDPDRDLLYQASRAGSLSALRPADGTEAWHYYEGQSQDCYNLAACTYWQDKIYVGTGTGRVVCLNADTHSILWSLTIGTKTGIGTPALDNGELYIPSLTGDIYRVDALTGAVTWHMVNTHNCYASAISLDDTQLYVMTSNGKVECRSRASGSLLWVFQTGSWTLAHLAVGAQGLYCTSDDRCMYRLDPATGAQIWRTCFQGNFARSSPFCAGDLILGSGCTGVFYGQDATSGGSTWSFDHGASNSFTDFSEADGLIFVTNLAGMMYCFHPANSPYPPSPTVSPTLTASATPTASPTATATPTASSSPTVTPSASATPSPSSSATCTASPSPSPSSTRTPSPSSTASPSVTQSSTPSLTPTITATFSQTPDATQTQVLTGDSGKRDPGEHQCYVAPNPVHGGPCHVVYHMRAAGNCKLRVFQASGDPVGLVEDHHDSAGVHSSEISTQRYAPGVYFCRADLAYDDGGEDKLPLTKFIVLKAR